MAIWLIRADDENEDGLQPYWSGEKKKLWVNEADLAARHTEKQKRAKIANGLVPDRSAWVAIPDTLRNFTREYELVIQLGIARCRNDYDIGFDGIKARVKARIAALREGEGTVGPDVRAVARRFGIPPTQLGIQRFLNTAKAE